MNKAAKKVLPQNFLMQNVYKSKKLDSYFNIKDSTKLEHQGLTYLTQYPEVSCNETYSGKIPRRLREGVLDHAGNDRKFNMVKHSSYGHRSSAGIYERLSGLNKGV